MKLKDVTQKLNRLLHIYKNRKADFLKSAFFMLEKLFFRKVWANKKGEREFTFFAPNLP